MFHHVSLGTNDLARARKFYDAVLSIVGFRLIEQDELSLDYGTAGVLFSLETPVDGQRASPGNGVHVAFQAPDRGAVEEFYRRALAHGGTDDGAPGLRPHYDPNYYGAFVRDPDGNKIEAVTYSGK